MQSKPKGTLTETMRSTHLDTRSTAPWHTFETAPGPRTPLHNPRLVKVKFSQIPRTQETAGSVLDLQESSLVYPSDSDKC